MVVNSQFTKGVVGRVWKGIGGNRGVGIVYPCVHVQDTEERDKATEKDWRNGSFRGSDELWKGKKVLLSINRFERKKDVGLAIKAFAGLQDRKDVRLVLAGKPEMLFW